MKRNAFVLFRVSHFSGWVFALFLTLVACEPENGLDNTAGDNEEEEEKVLDLSRTVDLGLSVRWAECNVGAESPEEYGYYFAWGEIEEKEAYSKSTYLYYNNNSYDNLGSDICGTGYDAAHAEWGGNWRMPTRDEMQELFDNCSWEWSSVNGVNGQKVTGPNGNSIFLPAAGYRENNTCYYPETFGYYWVGTLNTNSSDRAYCLGFRDGARMVSSASRYGGQPIRPVWGDEPVSQQQFIRILTNIYNVSYQANAIEVKVDSNVKFEYSILDASWIKEREVVTRAASTHNFVFEISKNTYCNIREAQIVFYNAEYALSDTLTLVQEGNPDIKAVNLGLSVKWASCNVGATSPEEYGDYFAWGETEPKDSYYSDNSVTYNLSISELESRGIIGADGNLTAAYDAATANWGGDWRMPTLDEIKELGDKCTWEWTTVNNVYGHKITGPNGNSIFLPVAGYCFSTSFYDADSFGYYWSATSHSNNYFAYYLYSGSKMYGWFHNYRYGGFPVRPVSE